MKNRNDTCPIIPLFKTDLDPDADLKISIRVQWRHELSWSESSLPSCRTSSLCLTLHLHTLPQNTNIQKVSAVSSNLAPHSLACLPLSAPRHYS